MNTETTGTARYTTSFGLALSLASVLNGALVVAKEKSPAVMAALQGWTGHHWVSHAVVVVGFFAGCGWLLARGNGGRGVVMGYGRLTGVVAAGVVAGWAMIVGYYLVAG